MTLAGLYKSKPIDQGVACVGVHAVGSTFMYGNSIASMFFLNCIIKMENCSYDNSPLFYFCNLSTVWGLTTYVADNLLTL